MKTGSERPDADSPQITFARIEPVHETAGKQHSYGVEQGKQSGNGTVVFIGPVELRRYELDPGKRKDLPVEIVDCKGEEKKGADDPPETGHPAVWFKFSVHSVKCGYIMLSAFSYY